MKTNAYFISDSTGITVETLGNSLLAQFPTTEFEKTVSPYIDTEAKARRLVEQINYEHQHDSQKPIIIVSVIKQHIREILFQCDGLILDMFNNFLNPIQDYLGTEAQVTVGKGHSTSNNRDYEKRIQAVHYALDNDDGEQFKEYESADVILVGVSRSGKTPACLYLGLHFGVYAANYPLTPEDLEDGTIPKALKAYRHKLFGLTIDPERLAGIREQRKANSRYASLTQCEDEIRMAEQVMRRAQLTILNTTSISVEEISTRIIAEMGLERSV